MSEGGTKYDLDKVRLDLFPPRAFLEIGEILTIGAEKYAPYNWAKGISYSRLFAATMRHLWAWWRGEDLDPETGKSHLAHAGCCIVFLLEMRHIHPELDDRYGWDERGKSATISVDDRQLSLPGTEVPRHRPAPPPQ